MAVVPAPDLTTLRTFPQGLLGRALSICPRTPVFQAQMNGAPLTDAVTGGIYAVNFDNVTLGAYTDAIEGLSVDFGTVAGARDLGTVRLRNAATVSQLPLAETAPGILPIVDDCFITVVEERRPWQAMPRLVPTKTGGASYNNSFIEYHDYNDTYTGQNTNIQPKANVCRELDANGDPLPYKPAGYVDAGETYRTVQLSSLASIAMKPGAVIDNVLWDVRDGTIILLGSDTDPEIVVQFPVGFRYCLLTVEDDNGTPGWIYFPIWVHDEDNAPITSFQVTREECGEGWEMAFTITGTPGVGGEASESVIGKGTHVCYWELPYFSGEDVPQQYVDQFQGWLTKDSTPLKLYQNVYMIEAAGPVFWLSAFDSFAQTLNNKTAAKWFNIPDLTLDLAAHYILRSYSNILELVNFYKTGITDESLEEQIKKANIWSQLVEMIKAARYSSVGCDALGGIWLRPYYSYLETADRANRNKVISIDNADWTFAEGFEWTDEYVGKVGIVLGSGSYFNGTKSFLVNSKAPGNTPDYAAGASEAPFQRLPASSSQDVLNKLTGHHFARENNRHPEVPITLMGDMDIMEVAWNEPIKLTYQEANIRDLEFIDREFLVRRISIAHSSERGQPDKKITWTLEEVTTGEIGVFAPVKKDELATNLTNYQMPNFNFPFSNIFPPVINPTIAGTGRLAIFDSNGFMGRTTQFSIPEASGGPPWDVQDLKLLPNWTGSNLQGFAMDAYSPGAAPPYSGAIDGYLWSDTTLMKINDIHGTVTLTHMGDFRDTSERRSGNFERGVDGWGVIVSWYGVDGVWAARVTDGASIAGEVLIDANYDTGTSLFFYPGIWLSPHVAGLCYTSVFTTTGNGLSQVCIGKKSTDYGENWATLAALDPGDGLAGVIAAPYQNQPGSTYYHVFSNTAGAGSILRRVKAGTGANITVDLGGSNFGPFGLLRAISIGDDNRNFQIVCGFNGGNGAVGFTRNAEAATPTYEVLFGPEVGYRYLQSYIAGEAIYLIGVNSEIGVGRAGAGVDSRKGNSTMTGQLLAIVG